MCTQFLFFPRLNLCSWGNSKKTEAALELRKQQKDWSFVVAETARLSEMGLFVAALLLMVISATCADEGRWYMFSVQKVVFLLDFKLSSNVVSMLDIPVPRCIFIFVLIVLWFFLFLFWLGVFCCAVKDCLRRNVFCLYKSFPWKFPEWQCFS